MRILALQFVPDVRGRPVPRFDPQLGTLLALMKQRGHELSLLGLARFDVDAVKSALARSLPQLIYADISAVCVDAARRTLEYIHEHEFLPIFVGGNYPTVDPAASLSLPGVQAVAIGEPDASLITYLERMKDPATGQVVLGMWLRDERGLARPDLPPLVEELDSLPFPERDSFGYDDYVRRSGEIEISAGRGCPQQCAYCVNDWLESIYEGKGTWVRRRSPENVVGEIDLLRQRYDGVRIVRFLDHAFALDREWLASFLSLYAERCLSPTAKEGVAPSRPAGERPRDGRGARALALRCHLRANSADEQTVRLLAQAGCKLVDVELISGSDFIRNEIFDMELSNAQIVEAFGRLRAASIRARAIFYLGAPYESEASLEQTRLLLGQLKPHPNWVTVDVRPYYPFPGTRAADLCRENGWLHVRGEEQYRADRNGIDMPACRPEKVTAFVKRLRQEFAAAVRAGRPRYPHESWWRRWLPTSRSPRARQG